MPTLPLYDPNPAHPNASHSVIAPGGYEWWHFDADDAAQDVQMVARFALGFPACTEYLRRYRRYRRQPTRNPPPLPADFPGVEFAVYERGRVVAKAAEQLPPSQFCASTERLDVKAGADSVVEEAGGSIRVHVRGAELTFRPLLAHPPHECSLVSRRVTPARHKWVVAAPLCSVEGKIRLPGDRVIRLSGRGFHDHQYGTAPLCEVMRWFVRGRTLTAGCASASFLQFPTGKPRAGYLRAVTANQQGVREAGGLFGADPFSSNPRFLDSTRWTSETKDGGGETGRGFYETVLRARPRWHSIRRLIPAPAART